MTLWKTPFTEENDAVGKVYKTIEDVDIVTNFEPILWTYIVQRFPNWRHEGGR